jgi:hypothetical protein
VGHQRPDRSGFDELLEGRHRRHGNIAFAANDADDVVVGAFVAGDVLGLQSKGRREHGAGRIGRRAEAGGRHLDRTPQFLQIVDRPDRRFRRNADHVFLGADLGDPGELGQVIFHFLPEQQRDRRAGAVHDRDQIAIRLGAEHRRQGTAAARPGQVLGQDLHLFRQRLLHIRRDQPHGAVKAAARPERNEEFDVFLRVLRPCRRYREGGP